MGVAKNRRPIAHAVIDVLVVVEIDDPRAHAALHVDGALLAPETKIRSHAERQAFDGALIMRVALGQVSGHDVPLELIWLIRIFRATVTFAASLVHNNYMLI